MEIIRSGKTILLSYPKSPHLWLILTNPEDYNNSVAIVMVRTRTSFTDPTVVLKVGDHPFIRHDSSVHYSTTKFMPIPNIQSELRIGRCHLKEDISKELLGRVRQGLLDSHFTVNAIKDRCKKIFSNY